MSEIVNPDTIILSSKQHSTHTTHTYTTHNPNKFLFFQVLLNMEKTEIDESTESSHMQMHQVTDTRFSEIFLKHAAHSRNRED